MYNVCDIDKYRVVYSLCDIVSDGAFCSNNGADVITKSTLEHWQKGKPREELRLMDMERLLTLGAFNEKGCI